MINVSRFITKTGQKNMKNTAEKDVSEEILNEMDEQVSSHLTGTAAREQDSHDVESLTTTESIAEIAKEEHGIILDTFNNSLFIADFLHELELLMLLLRAILALTDGEMTVKEHDMIAPLYSRLKIANKDMETINLVSKIYLDPEDLEKLNEFFFTGMKDKKMTTTPNQYM